MPGVGIILFVALVAFTLALFASEWAAGVVAESARKRREAAAHGLAFAGYYDQRA